MKDTKMAEKTRPNFLKRVMRGTLAAKLGVFGPPLVILAIGFAVAGKFIQPAPPDTLTIASGGTSGAGCACILSGQAAATQFFILGPSGQDDGDGDQEVDMNLEPDIGEAEVDLRFAGRM